MAWTLTSTKPPPCLHPVTINGNRLPPCVGVVAGTVLCTHRVAPRPLDAGERLETLLRTSGTVARSTGHVLHSPGTDPHPTGLDAHPGVILCPPDLRGHLHTVLYIAPELGLLPPSVHLVSCRDHPPWVCPVSWRDPRLHLDPAGHGGHLPVDPVPVQQIVDVADADSQLTSVYYSSVPNPPERYSVQDRDTDTDMPNMDPPTVPSAVKHPLTLEDFQKIIEDSDKPPVLTHYGDPFPSHDNNSQLVPIERTSGTGPSLTASDELETHVIFRYYRSFLRMSGDQDREAQVSAYKELMSLMLSQASEDKHLINIPPSRTKTEGPFHSNLESQAELKKTEEKFHLQWPPIKATQRVVDRTLGLYQHGQQPKAGLSSATWPPPTVTNVLRQGI